MDAPPKNDERDADKEAKAGTASAKSTHPKKVKNNVRKIRMEKMMSKAELARRAGLSTLTPMCR